MATPWTHRPSWTALASVGIAGMAALAPSDSALSGGGLAVIALAAAAAVVLGLPIADLEARTRSDTPSRTTTAVRSLGDTWLAVAAGAAVAPMVAANGWSGVMLAALAWSVVAVAGGSRRGLAAIGALLALAVAAVGAVLAVAQGVPWTFLDPPERLALVEYRSWLGIAVVMGLLLSGAGFGHWSEAERVHRRTPVAVIGLGLLVLIGAMIRRAAAWEAGLMGGGDPVDIILGLVLAVTAILAVGWRSTGPRPLRAAVGLLATLLFAGPAWDALPLWWSVLLPLGMALCVGLRAVQLRGASLVRGLFATVALVFVAALGWPGLPGPLASATLGILPVLALWITGTRVLLRRPA